MSLAAVIGVEEGNVKMPFVLEILFVRGLMVLGLIVSMAACSKPNTASNTPPGQTPASGPAAPGQPSTGQGGTPSTASPNGQTAPANNVYPPEQQPGQPPSSTAPQQTAPPPPPPPRVANFDAGTTLAVRTTSTLSTKVIKSGARFIASLNQPLTSDGWTVARRGATVEGLVVDATEGGKVKGRAALTIKVTHFVTSDGQRIAVSTSPITTEAKSTKGKDAGKVGIGAGAGALIGGIAGGGKGAGIGALVGGGAGTAVVLSTHGAPAVIPAESLLNFRLTAPVSITERPNPDVGGGNGNSQPQH